ncbi:MAG: N-acetylmuramoyl-L-alanine amidase [Nitrospira sp.]|nr:N-acetylmuramoyl-L-alanine amidase [Nitrospira sp.]
MAKCPFATWEEISGAVGSYKGGPFKIVHHTTEGSSYAAAKAAYRENKSDPHFTVVGEEVFQHIDTSLGARALRNEPGNVETNLDSAIQIEVVGFAAQRKDTLTLKTVAKLCRWIEGEHTIQQRWPNGPPRWSTNGKDPGGHNRSASVWDAEGGHYGHSQVPENSHWDPGYTPTEVAFVTPDAAFDLHHELATTTAGSGVTQDQTFRLAESAQAIAERVIAALGSAPLPSGLSPLRRVTVRVVSGANEVSIIVEGGDDRDATPQPTRGGQQSSRRKQTLKSAIRKRG